MSYVIYNTLTFNSQGAAMIYGKGITGLIRNLVPIELDGDRSRS